MAMPDCYEAWRDLYQTVGLDIGCRVAGRFHPTLFPHWGPDYSSWRNIWRLSNQLRRIKIRLRKYHEEMTDDVMEMLEQYITYCEDEK